MPPGMRAWQPERLRYGTASVGFRSDAESAEEAENWAGAIDLGRKLEPMAEWG